MNSLSKLETNKEIANAITHGMGVLWAIVFIPVLIARAVMFRDDLGVFGVCVYAFSMLFVLSSSTIYHAITDSNVKRVFRVIDHISIYFMIAGSYTGIILLRFVESKLAVSMLIAMWVMVLAGIVFKVFYTTRFKALSTIMYLVMGWSVLIMIKPMYTLLPREAFWLLVLGGVSYSVGTIFYLWKKWPYHHAIWHIFVLMGVFLHYCSILYLV